MCDYSRLMTAREDAKVSSSERPVRLDGAPTPRASVARGRVRLRPTTDDGRDATTRASTLERTTAVAVAGTALATSAKVELTTATATAATGSGMAACTMRSASFGNVAWEG